MYKRKSIQETYLEMIKKLNNSGFLGGTVWTTLSFIIVTIVYLLRISILTRYLEKADFGLVAIVLFVLGFTNIFADLGVSTSLLSQKNVSKKEYSSLYWGGLILSIALYVLISLSSPLFANFYEQEDLNYLIPIMGLDLIISSIGRQFSVFKQKEYKFKQLAIIKIVSELFSLGVAVILAMEGYGIWSLIISLLTTSFINSILNFILGYKQHPLLIYFNISETKHLYKVGFYQTGTQILDFLSSQLDILILGKIISVSDMGVYSILKTFSFRIYQSINQIITKVCVPYFAKLDVKSPTYKEKYLNVTSLVVVLNIIVYTIIIINSREVLEIFYGDLYIDYDFILIIFCIWGFFSSIINCSASILTISTGRTDLGFKWTQFRLLLNPLFILIGGYFYKMEGIVYSQAIYSIVTIIFYKKIVISKIIKNFRIIELIKCIIIPLIISIISIITIVSLLSFIKINIYLQIIITSLVVLIIHQLLIGKQIYNILKKLKI